MIKAPIENSSFCHILIGTKKIDITCYELHIKEEETRILKEIETFKMVTGINILSEEKTSPREDI